MNNSNNKTKYIKNGDGSISIDTKSVNHCCKLVSRNWLSDVPGMDKASDIVEIRFKNTRKDFYRNVNALQLNAGDIVAVEASPGHDIGIVTLTGHLAFLQMKKKNIDIKSYEFKKVYRKTKQMDIDKWEEAQKEEEQTLRRARAIIEEMKLNMKLGDVEYQGDKTKAIFYYIADERVDFRSLIKRFAEEFRIRIEMKQIGARQEAGRIGSIAPCGRELCCCTWKTTFMSVPTNSARIQELPINAQKLAGQCSKLKCCLIYELDVYLDALEDIPKNYMQLSTKGGIMYHQKTEILKKTLWYSYEKVNPKAIYPLLLKKVKEVLELNRQGKKSEKLVTEKDIRSMPQNFSYYDKPENIDQLKDD